MINVDLKPLIGRLNETSRKGLEAAAEICLSRKHYNLEVEHWLLGLLDLTNSDLAMICRRFEVDLALTQSVANVVLLASVRSTSCR